MKEEDKVKWDKNLEFVDRRFLNQSNYHTTANVVAKISSEFYNERPYCDFHISDCNRTISLDIDSDNEDDLKNSIYKMEQIIDVATEMKDALIKLKPYLKKLEEEKLRKKKKREEEELNES
jgi:Ser-tRNA(Ala) deacylase AlaX